MSRWIGLAGVAIAMGVCSPAAAVAGTYTWSMPNDFTAVSPGSNPDHDNYGGTPWSYAVFDGTAAAPLSFSSSIQGGLSGWWDGGNGFVAENASGRPVDGVPAGRLAMQPPQGGTSQLTWRAPLSGTISVTGSVTQATPGAPTCRFVWALSNGTAILANGASDGGTSISASPGVQPGTRLLLYVQDASAAFNPPCVTAVVSLTIRFVSSAPSVTLTSPADGSTMNGQPTFSGSAGSAFGASGNVAVRVYSGSSASGSPVETLGTPVAGGSYSVGTSPALGDGTYTAQAEQDDLAGDQGFSSPVTFTVQNVPPAVTLDPVTAAFVTSTPTLTGTAGTASDDNPQVYLGLYSGVSASGPLVRLLSTTRASNGAFSVAVAPGLPDGLYTAVAGQGSIGGNGFSRPVVIEIKTRPPALSFEQPDNDAAINVGATVFSGGAGNAVGDIPTVRLTLYYGPLAAGRPVGTRLIRAAGSSWSYVWPGSLRVGFYTAVIEQADNAGHVVTIQHTFLVTVLPHVIGYVLNLDRGGNVAIRITCPAEAGYCVGDVLAVTVRRLQPVRGGPVGPVRLLFVHVKIRAGRTELVRRKLARAVTSTLRSHVPMEVRVSAILAPTHGRLIRVFQTRLLSVG